MYTHPRENCESRRDAIIPSRERCATVGNAQIIVDKRKTLRRVISVVLCFALCYHATAFRRFGVPRIALFRLFNDRKD